MGLGNLASVVLFDNRHNAPAADTVEPE